MKKLIGIYQFSFSNGMVYVGQSIDVTKRHGQHLKLLHQNKHTNPRVQACYNKHGAPVFEILQVLSDDQYSASYLTELERAAFDSLDNAVRLNANRPGDAYIPGPTGRAARSAEMKSRFEDPEYREAHLARVRDPAARAAQSAHNKVRYADPAARAAQSARMKACAEDPEYRAANSARQSTPSARAANSARGKTQWADPTVRAAQSARAKAQMSTPAARVANSARQATPEFKAAQSVAISEARSKWLYSTDDVTFSRASVLAVIIGVTTRHISTAAGQGGRCRGHKIFRILKTEVAPATGRRLTSENPHDIIPR